MIIFLHQENREPYPIVTLYRQRAQKIYRNEYQIVTYPF